MFNRDEGSVYPGIRSGGIRRGHGEKRRYQGAEAQRRRMHTEGTMSKIYSVPGLFGGEDFYDENGQKVGYSVPGVLGGRDFYDADGQPAGYSVDGIISGEDFYGRDGRPSGYSVPGIFGGNDYYDESGARAGYSVPGIGGGENIRLDRDPFGIGGDDPFDGFGPEE